MTKWRCDSGTRNKHSTFSSLSKLSLSNVHKCRGSRATPPGRPLAFSPLQYAMRLRLMCRDAILASPRANDNIIITQQSRTFGTSTRSWSSCARGTPFVSFPSGGSDWTAKWPSDSQLSAKSHSARFLVNDDDSARCCCCRCCFPPHGQLDIFNAPLWPYQRRHMSLRVLSLLSLLSSLFSCPSLMCGPRQPQQATLVCPCVRRASAQLECEIYNTI